MPEREEVESASGAVVYHRDRLLDEDEEPQELEPEYAVDEKTAEMLKQTYSLTAEEVVRDFANGRGFLQAPFITVPSYTKAGYSTRWRFLQTHVNGFRREPRKRFVPRFRKSARVKPSEFIERFMMTSTPVVIPSEAMRHLGWDPSKVTMREMLEIYPENVTHSPPWRYEDGYYPWDAKREEALLLKNKSPTAEVDLGPAVRKLASRTKLQKFEKLQGRSGRRFYSFPRNLKVLPEQISTLGITEGPPLVPTRMYQDPAVWMASSTSVTNWHHDCCDNMNFEIMGTKRWILAPPTDSKHIYYRCGTKEKPKSYCVGGTGIKNWNFQKVKDKTNYVELDLRPGDVLYLPAGWFHAVEQPAEDAKDEPATLSVNFWFKSWSTGTFAYNRAQRGCKGLGWKCIAREMVFGAGAMTKLEQA